MIIQSTAIEPHQTYSQMDQEFMNNELKLIAKILEDNKIQINTQNIQLKSILYHNRCNP